MLQCVTEKSSTQHRRWFFFQPDVHPCAVSIEGVTPQHSGQTAPCATKCTEANFVRGRTTASRLEIKVDVVVI